MLEGRRSSADVNVEWRALWSGQLQSLDKMMAVSGIEIRRANTNQSKFLVSFVCFRKAQILVCVQVVRDP